MNALTTATPSEIDTALAAIYERFYTALNRVSVIEGDVENSQKRIDRVTRTGGTPSTWDQDSLTRSLESLANAKAKAQEIIAEATPYEDEYRRRPWTRAWKVTNAGGHIHNTMACQTCFPTTQFAWLPQVSGSPESEIVELAASAACTICFPTAPVDRPTSLFTADEQAAQAAREARAAAKIEREAKAAAKAIVPVRVSSYETLRTITAARTWLTDSYSWGHDHPSYTPEKVALVAEAVAAKESKSIEQVLAEAERRAAKRR